MMQAGRYSLDDLDRIGATAHPRRLSRSPSPHYTRYTTSMCTEFVAEIRQSL